jgi:type I restriction enzyme S subunit
VTVVPLGRIAHVSWGNTSITKASYVSSGTLAYSAAGPDGFLPHAEHVGPGIVLSAIGSVGNLHYAKGEWTAIKNTITITPLADSEVDLKYLFHYLNSGGIWRSRGGTQQFIGLGTAKEVPVPLLPLPEQHRIAAILDKADELRAKRKVTLTQLDTLTQGTFLELFGDPQANPNVWRMTSMRTLFAAPPIFGTMIPPVAEMRGWLALRVGNIQNWNLDLTDRKYVDLPPAVLERHTVRDGDLLLARAIASEAHLGKCVVARPRGQRWAFDSHLMRLRFDPTQVEPEYVRHLFRTPGGRRMFLGASRKTTVQFNINTKEMAALQIPVPPMDRQKTFVDYLVQVERVRSSQQASLAGLSTLFFSLQHRAFTGTL